MAYKTFIKYFIFILVAFFITSCSEKEDKKVDNTIKLKSEQAVVITKKEQENIKPKEVFVEKTVISGAREEEVLAGFTLAISQIMIEEGVFVPSCDKLAATKFISYNDCEEVAGKYFGFYEITDEGSYKKVEDLFENGVIDNQIEIRSTDIEYFDYTKNPLLNDSYKIREVIAISGDSQLLKSLENFIPIGDVETKKLLEQKIALLDKFEIKDSDFNQDRNFNENTEAIKENIKDDNSSNGDNYLAAKNNNEQEQVNNNAIIESQLAILKQQNQRTKAALANDPSNQQLINQNNEELRQIAILEAQLK